jgi:DNA-binding IclR family transcriptional regulator
VVYLETRESRRSRHLVSRVGRTLPAYATALGKALLAELTDAEITGLMPTRLSPLTESTITSREALCADLAVVRARGYAVEHEEGTPGVACVAAVVPYRIPGTDAVSCSMPVAGITKTTIPEVGAFLRQAADALGQELRRAGIR